MARWEIEIVLYHNFYNRRAAAFSNGCEIMEQDQFMPLWYTLRIKESGGNNSVEAANSIYETDESHDLRMARWEIEIVLYHNFYNRY